jgi:hypothetical protein
VTAISPAPWSTRLKAASVLAGSIGWLKVTLTVASGVTKMPVGLALSTIGAAVVKEKL